MRSALIDFIEYLKKEGVDVDHYHWLPKGKPKKIFYTKLEQMMKKEDVLTDSYYLKKTCLKKNCLNPLHYRIVPHLNDLPDPQEVAELIELIDIEMCQNLGFDSYLTLFNDGNPLPAKREDMKAAVAIVLSKLGRKSELMWQETMETKENKEKKG